MSLAMTTVALLLVLGGGGQVENASAPPQGSMPIDLMPYADTDRDGKVTAAEYRAFSEQGWGFVAPDKDEVDVSHLDQMAQIAFVGVTPNAKGIITRQMYIDAIPSRFKMLDRNGDGTLNSDELHGRVPQ